MLATFCSYFSQLLLLKAQTLQPVHIPLKFYDFQEVVRLEAMEEYGQYVQNVLSIEKKGGGFRPCSDYRRLNEISVKYSYPLPFVPTALEQL